MGYFDDSGGYHFYKQAFVFGSSLYLTGYLFYIFDKASKYEIYKEYKRIMGKEVKKLYVYEKSDDIKYLTELTNEYISDHNFIFDNHDQNEFSTIGKMEAYNDIISLIKKKIEEIEEQ